MYQGTVDVASIRIWLRDPVPGLRTRPKGADDHPVAPQAGVIGQGDLGFHREERRCGPARIDPETDGDIGVTGLAIGRESGSARPPGRLWPQPPSGDGRSGQGRSRWGSDRQIPAVAGHIFDPERGGNVVAGITTSRQAAGGTQVRQQPDGGVPEQVKVAGRLQADLRRNAEHLRVHDGEVIARLEHCGFARTIADLAHGNA